LTDGSSRTILIRRSDRQRVPWKNGAGATEVIATGEGQPAAWRISVADLGPARTTFSSFPGLHRVFTVVGDHGVTLSWGSRTVDLDPLVPLPFDGELAPDCVASGPTSAFNVMVDVTAATARVEPHHLSHSAVLVARQSVEVTGTATILMVTIHPLALDQRV
jgi:environmental stress-induced protein Ves